MPGTPLICVKHRLWQCALHSPIPYERIDSPEPGSCFTSSPNTTVKPTFMLRAFYSQLVSNNSTQNMIHSFSSKNSAALLTAPLRLSISHAVPLHCPPAVELICHKGEEKKMFTTEHYKFLLFFAPYSSRRTYELLN